MCVIDVVHKETYIGMDYYGWIALFSLGEGNSIFLTHIMIALIILSGQTSVLALLLCHNIHSPKPSLKYA